MSFKAIADAPCAICGITIYTGNVTRPIQAYDEKTHSIKTHITWSHLDCVPPNDDRVPICKHWIRRGECMYQSICLFRHPDESRHEGESNRSNLDLRGRRGQRLRRRVFNEGTVVHSVAQFVKQRLKWFIYIIVRSMALCCEKPHLFTYKISF